MGLSSCTPAPTMAQSQISRTLRDEAARLRIVAILSQERFDSRRAFARRICGEFSFVDTRGRLQLAGCMKALADAGSGVAGDCPAGTTGSGGEQAAPA